MAPREKSTVPPSKKQPQPSGKGCLFQSTSKRKYIFRSEFGVNVTVDDIQDPPGKFVTLGVSPRFLHLLLGLQTATVKRIFQLLALPVFFEPERAARARKIRC